MTSPFHRRNVLVYTSDRHLRVRVLALGASVKGAGALSRMMEHDRNP